MTWEPIETAPKDGTYILVCSPHKYRDTYIDVTHWWHTDRWMIEWMEGYGTPTHWMPLPLPPSPNSERKDDGKRDSSGLVGDSGCNIVSGNGDFLRPVAPAPAESGEQIARQKLNEASIAADEAMERMSKLFASPPDLEGVIERLEHAVAESGRYTAINRAAIEAASLLRAMQEQLDGGSGGLARKYLECERQLRLELTASRQEAERLREALEKIANHVGDRGCTYDAEIARAILNAHQGE